MNRWAMMSWVVLALAATGGAQAKDNGDGTYTNPAFYADYPDPDIIRVGDDYYLASSTFANSPGLVILQSKDLVNWRHVAYVVDRLDGDPKFDMVGGDMYRNGVFAPSIRYNKGTFYVAVTPNGKNTRIYYSKEITGPWKYHDIGESDFDPGLFFDDDGKAYIFTAMNSEGVVTLKTLSPELDKVVNSLRIHSYRGIEGSHVIKTNGYYYLFSANPQRMMLMCSRAKAITGPWEIQAAGQTSDTIGGHQGAIVDLPNGAWYGFVMCDKGAVGRMTYLSPISWKDDWPVWGTEGRVPATAPKPIKSQDVSTMPTSEDFDRPQLPLEWEWNHNPDNEKWSLTERAGFMRLKPTVAPDFFHARNSLTHKGWGPTSTAVAKLDISHVQPGDVAGLGMIGKGLATLAVQRAEDGQTKLVLSTGVESQTPVAERATADIGKDTTVYLALQMDFTKNQGRCAYSKDGRKWTLIGDDFRLLWDCGTGTFQGEQYAVYCYNPKSSAGYLDVDSVHFMDLELKKP